MQKIKVYVSILAMMIAGQSYAALVDGAVGGSAASGPVTPVAPGVAVTSDLEGVLVSSFGSRIKDLLDLRSLSKLSQVSKEGQMGVRELYHSYEISIKS